MTKKDFYLKAVIETYAALLRNSRVVFPSVRDDDVPDKNIFTMEDALDATDHLQEIAINLAACLANRVEDDSTYFLGLDGNEHIFDL